MTFADLGLSPDVLKAVADAGYSEPTPIQREAIPYVLMGRDLLGKAQTGTGKTAAFSLPMIDILASGRSRPRMPRALILEPTRELAQQVAEAFETFGKYHKISSTLIIGGTSMGPQEQALDRGVDVLIATPGRLIDLFERGKVILSGVKILVIDEADRMLDMGFIPDVERIVGLLPQQRQTLFFSATIPPEIKRLIDRFLSLPKEITIQPKITTAETIEDFVVMVPERDKREALRRLLRKEEIANAIVFCNRKRDADILFRSLKKHGFNVGVLHGDLTQDVRDRTLQGFRDNEIAILVASDVAARGLDVQGISHVFNFDVPFNAEDYVHRIGRTGRAGRSGRAFTLATGAETRSLDAVERFVKRQISRFEIEGFEPSSQDSDSDDRRPDRGGRGRRARGGRGRDRRPHDAAPPDNPREDVRVAQTDEAPTPALPPDSPAPIGHAPQPAAKSPRNEGHRHEGQRKRNEQGRDRNRRPPREDDDPSLSEHAPAFLFRTARIGPRE